MISARHAMLRQAQEYFHALLLGVVRWDDVEVDKAIPVPSIRGQRDQGTIRDLVVARFNGFKMELAGPFEDERWPLGRISPLPPFHAIACEKDRSNVVHIQIFK